MGTVLDRWQNGKGGWIAQLVLRGAGFGLLWTAFRWAGPLFRGFSLGAATGTLPAAGPHELAIAFVVFAAGSTGAMLVSLGPLLLRHYPVPVRYRGYF